MRKRRRYFLLFGVLGFLALVFAAIGGGGTSIKQGSYVQLDIGGNYPEAPPRGLLNKILSDHQPTLLDLLKQIRALAEDSRIDGVIVRVTPLDIGWAKLQEIRDALVELRVAGKHVIGVIEQEALSSTREYYLASVTHPLYLSPGSTAPLNGLAAQFLFLGGVWEKLDIQMNVEKIREYKTAGDMIANKSMTAAHREMANSLLDSMSAQIVSGIAKERDLDEAVVRTWIDAAPATARAFEDAKLSDGVKHIQDVKTEVSPDNDLVQGREYAAPRHGSRFAPSRRKIAVIYAAGNIVTGPGGNSPSADLVGADALSKALEEAQDDESVRAIILRIDSPGGSALASDLIWRATQSARKRKPIVVSMSDLAASGGYYIAAGADRILAQPGTLTGSIGVVFMRPYVRDFLQKFGVTAETLTRGKFADMNDLTSPLDAERRQHLVAEMEHIYSVFVDRVAEGRKLSSERVNEIGRGRVWTGAQAKEVGLVDELGGFRSAERVAKELGGFSANEEADLMFYPRSESLLGRVAEFFATRSTITLPPLLRRATQAFLLPFEENTMLTLMPAEIELR